MPLGGSTEMHQYQCGHKECRGEFIELSRGDLMRRVADHLREAHDVDRTTKTLMGYLEATCVEEMHEFQCAHEECRSEFTESDRDDLMRRIADHLREAHNVDRATGTLMSYLEATSVSAR
jgi:predicted small metal-binding protein